MRWFLLLLLLLNAFYYVWHQQQAPLRAKEVAPASSYQGARKDIRLLSEAESPRLPARQPEVEPQAAASEAAVCLFLGSFEEESRARVVEQRLLSLDIQAEVHSIDAAAGVEYWVYLPPLASRQASLRQLRELQARRIDSYIITQGSWLMASPWASSRAAIRPTVSCSAFAKWVTSRRCANCRVPIAVSGCGWPRKAGVWPTNFCWGDWLETSLVCNIN